MADDNQSTLVLVIVYLQHALTSQSRKLINSITLIQRWSFWPSFQRDLSLFISFACFFQNYNHHLSHFHLCNGSRK